MENCRCADLPERVSDKDGHSFPLVDKGDTGNMGKTNRKDLTTTMVKKWDLRRKIQKSCREPPRTLHGTATGSHDPTQT